LSQESAAPSTTSFESFIAPAVNPWVIAITVMLGTFMEVLDTSIANVSLPNIAGSLSATIDESTWVLTSYLVSNAIVLPMTGWLASYFGRKRFFISCLACFTIASFLCGMAPSLGWLVVFRVLQGIGGGALQPISQAILLESFPPRKRGLGMAVWGVGVVFAPIIGPTVGGWVTDNYGWHWIFFMNIPVGVLAILMAKLFVFDPIYLKPRASKIDYFGLALLIVGVGCLQVFLDQGERNDWLQSAFVARLAIAAGIGIIGFIVWELYTNHPLINLRLLKDANFAAGSTVMLTVGAVLYSSISLLPIFLQTLMGYTATLSGLILSPRGVGTLIFMPVVGVLVGKVDARRLVAIGIIFTALPLIWLAGINLQVDQAHIVTPIIVQGVGLAFIFVPLTTATFSTMRREEMGNATGLFNLMRNIGGSLGISLSQTLLDRLGQFHHARLAEHLSPYNPQVTSWLHRATAAFTQRGSSPEHAHQQALRLLDFLTEQQAMAISFNDCFWIMGVLFLAALPLLFLMKRPQHSGAPVGTH